MSDKTELPGIGHNQGPPFDPAVFQQMEELAKGYGDVAGEWKAAAPIQDDEAEGKATDFLTGARGAYKAIEEARKVAKQPHLDAGKAVDDAFKPLLEVVKGSADAVKAKLNVWLTEKQRQQEAEAKAQREAAEAEAKRLAAEAAAEQDALERARKQGELEAAEKAAAEAAKPAKTQARSATGAGRTVSQRTTYSAEIKNLPLAMKHFADAPEMLELVQRLANAEARRWKDEMKIPGVKLITEKTL